MPIDDQFWKDPPVYCVQCGARYEDRCALPVECPHCQAPLSLAREGSEEEAQERRVRYARMQPVIESEDAHFFRLVGEALQGKITRTMPGSSSRR